MILILLTIITVIITIINDNNTFQFPSNSYFKVMFQYDKASCSINFFGNFIPQRRTNER